MVILNILILIFEILYYSLFMYYAKREGKVSKYILLFSLITIVMLIVGTNNLHSFIIFVILTILGMKNIIKCNTYFFDIFITFIMLLSKFIIELILFYVLYIFSKNVLLNALIYGFIKIMMLVILNKKYNFTIQYAKLKNKWDKNIFFIRYSFIVFMFVYVIISCIYLLKM